MHQRIKTVWVWHYWSLIQLQQFICPGFPLSNFRAGRPITFKDSLWSIKVDGARIWKHTLLVELHDNITGPSVNGESTCIDLRPSFVAGLQFSLQDHLHLCRRRKLREDTHTLFRLMTLGNFRRNNSLNAPLWRTRIGVKFKTHVMTFPRCDMWLQTQNSLER